MGRRRLSSSCLKKHMRYPIPTGPAARILHTIEPRLNGLIRRGRLNNPPPVVAGRRLWGLEHLLEAAAALGVLTPQLEVALRQGCAAADSEECSER